MELYTVYVIEDDLEDRMFFSMATEKMPNVHCRFASGGTLALEEVAKDTGFLPNSIFIDINMQVMNGVECLKHIRKLKHLESIPIYMYSTSINSDLKNECIELGANDVIEKMASLKDTSAMLSKIFFGNAGDN